MADLDDRQHGGVRCGAIAGGELLLRDPDGARQRRRHRRSVGSLIRIFSLMTFAPDCWRAIRSAMPMAAQWTTIEVAGVSLQYPRCYPAP